MSVDGLISVQLLNLANIHSSTNKLMNIFRASNIEKKIGTGLPKFGGKLKPAGEGLGPGLRAFDLAGGRGGEIGA